MAPILIAIALLGAATGLRTMTPIAALCWFAYLHRLPVEHTWAFWSAQLISVLIFTLMAAGEYIGDKLPITPSRLDLVPLTARLAFGALVGAILTTALHASIPAGIALGAISALAGALTGYHLRVALKSRLHLPDLPIALAEDACTLTLALTALLTLPH